MYLDKSRQNTPVHNYTDLDSEGNKLFLVRKALWLNKTGVTYSTRNLKGDHLLTYQKFQFEQEDITKYPEIELPQDGAMQLIGSNSDRPFIFISDKYKDYYLMSKSIRGFEKEVLTMKVNVLGTRDLMVCSDAMHPDIASARNCRLVGAPILTANILTKLREPMSENAVNNSPSSLTLTFPIGCLGYFYSGGQNHFPAYFEQKRFQLFRSSSVEHKDKCTIDNSSDTKRFGEDLLYCMKGDHVSRIINEFVPLNTFDITEKIPEIGPNQFYKNASDAFQMTNIHYYQLIDEIQSYLSTKTFDEKKNIGLIQIKEYLEKERVTKWNKYSYYSFLLNALRLLLVWDSSIKYLHYLIRSIFGAFDYREFEEIINQWNNPRTSVHHWYKYMKYYELKNNIKNIFVPNKIKGKKWDIYSGATANLS